MANYATARNNASSVVKSEIPQVLMRTKPTHAVGDVFCSSLFGIILEDAMKVASTQDLRDKFS